MSRSTCSESGKPPFSTMPEIDGNVADACAVSTPSSTSLRSPGTTTTEPSMSRGSTFSIDIAATTTPSASRLSRSGSPAYSSPSTASMIVRIEGATRYGSSGIAQTATDAAASVVARRSTASTSHRAAAATRSTISASRSGSARFTTMPSRVACSRSSSSTASSVSWASSSGVRASAWPSRSERPAALADPAAEHEQHGGAEVRGDARVVGELGRAADIGEVGADDDDRVAAVLDRLEAPHDGGERLVGVGVHVVVADADRLVVWIGTTPSWASSSSST